MNGFRHRYEYVVDPASDSAAAYAIQLIGTRRRILELGAGPGSITRVLKENSERFVVSIENDESAIPSLKRFADKVIRADLNEGAWLQFVKGELPFDGVLCTDVLEHLYEPAKVIKRIAGLLAPSSSLVVSVPHVGHSAIHACLYHSDFDYRDWGLLDRTHIRFFGLKNIGPLLMEGGLKIVETRFVIRDPEQTELSSCWSALPSSLTRELRSNPLGKVYQIVVRAVPLSHPAPSIDLVSQALAWKSVR